MIECLPEEKTESFQFNNFSVLNTQGRVKSIDKNKWQYVDPKFWNTIYPENCNGQMQSPVNIVKSDTVYDKCLKNFKFNNYNLEIEWKMVFDGFSGNHHFLIFNLYLYVCKIKINITFV